MRLDTYTILFQELARRHVDVQATAKNGRFLRIFISADPVQKQLDLTSFYNALRSDLKVKPGEQCFVLENYQTDYGDNNGDYYSRELSAAFLVLGIVENVNDYATRERAIAACEQIAEEIFALAVEQLRVAHAAYITVGDAWAEHVGPLTDGFVGVRFNFSWREPATQDLTPNLAKFLP